MSAKFLKKGLIDQLTVVRFDYVLPVPKMVLSFSGQCKYGDA